MGAQKCILMWFEGIFETIGVLYQYFGTIWKVGILCPGTGFLWPGAGRTGAQAGQLDGAGWPAAVRQAGGRTGSPAAGLPPYAAVRVCAAVGGRVCGLGVRVCGGGGGGGGGGEPPI